MAYDQITDDQYGGSSSTYYDETDLCQAGIVHLWKGDGLYYRCGGHAEADGYCWRHAPLPPPPPSGEGGR